MSDRVFLKRYSVLRRMVDRRVAALARSWSAHDLDEGCRYVLSGGGKRVRSTLLLLSCEAVGGTARQAVDAGAAVEAMHNFTLVHDDIMDNARTRRGKPTVHTRWNVNTALLVGDVLIGQAYESLMRTRIADAKRIVPIFTGGMLEVCEGQALDMQLERSAGVSRGEYFRMIEKKTAMMIAMAAHIGGVIGGGTRLQVGHLRRFGHHLGRAFQIQDDLLDITANEKDFGKVTGGDIIEGKKTFLLIETYRRARGKDKALLATIMKRRHTPAGHRLVDDVHRLYERYGVIDSARQQVRKDTDRAVAMLSRLPTSAAREMLFWFSGYLLDRTT